MVEDLVEGHPPTPGLEAEAVSEDAAARQRQCGRCQLMFPADAGLHPSAQVGWWLCPPCRESLTGHRSEGRF